MKNSARFALVVVVLACLGGCACTEECKDDHAACCSDKQGECCKEKESTAVEATPKAE